MKLVSTNPSQNYKPIGSVRVSTAKEIRSAVISARKAAPVWKELGLDARIKHMRRLIREFAAKKKDFSLLIAREMGMPVAYAEADYDGGIAFLNWYCDNAHAALSPEITFENKNETHYIVHEPRGVTAVIVPWNFPFTNFVWQVGQNLICGNTVVFKHSEETPLCGEMIEDVFVAAKFPKGVFNEVYGGGDVGEMLAESDVDAICFTGSTKTGAKLYNIASRKMIPIHMELGGSSPGIVFEDADMKTIARDLFNFRFGNCGQECKALKRLIVHKSREGEVISQLLKLLATKRIGDAQYRETDFGPLVAERQVRLLEAQVKDAVKKGARVLMGGKRPREHQGAYYEPTVLTGVTKKMRVWKEEVFGPVLPIVTFESEDEAVMLANDTQYGLGAYVFTQNTKLFERVAGKIDSGMVSQNTTNFVRACNPFGGYKKSGLGREHGKYGFLELTQIKTVTLERR